MSWGHPVIVSNRPQLIVHLLVRCRLPITGSLTVLRRGSNFALLFLPPSFAHYPVLVAQRVCVVLLLLTRTKPLALLKLRRYCILCFHPFDFRINLQKRKRTAKSGTDRKGRFSFGFALTM